MFLNSSLTRPWSRLDVANRGSNLIYTRRFAPRAAYATRYACSGRKNGVKRTKVHDWSDVSANWRLQNAKSPTAMLQENNTDATRMYTAYVPGISLYSRCMYVCLEACDNRAFVARMTNRHGHWMCWTTAACSACWMLMGGKNSLNTHSKQQCGTCAWSDSKETAGHVSHTSIHTKNCAV